MPCPPLPGEQGAHRQLGKGEGERHRGQQAFGHVGQHLARQFLNRAGLFNLCPDGAEAEKEEGMFLETVVSPGLAHLSYILGDGGKAAVIDPRRDCDAYLRIAAREGCRWLAYGANVDDLGDYRPGMQSARQRGVRAPLIEAGLGKAEIRALSRRLGLPTWDKPSLACLSSRFQYGDPITPEKLRQVDQAEAVLRSLGFRQFRVRHHDRLARLEISLEELPRLWEDGRHQAVVARLRALGYVYVTVDLAGFQSGSANLLLALGRRAPAPDA